MKYLYRIATKYTEANKFNVFSFDKVETVGDKYMAVSGLPLKCEMHAHNIINLCLDMQEIAEGIVINGKRVEVGDTPIV